MKLPAYPKYKPSGVEWLGDVPEKWEVKRLKYVAGLSDVKIEADPEMPVPYIGLEHLESWTGKLLPLDLELQLVKQHAHATSRTPVIVNFQNRPAERPVTAWWQFFPKLGHGFSRASGGDDGDEFVAVIREIAGNQRFTQLMARHGIVQQLPHAIVEFSVSHPAAQFRHAGRTSRCPGLLNVAHAGYGHEPPEFITA